MDSVLVLSEEKVMWYLRKLLIAICLLMFASYSLAAAVFQNQRVVFKNADKHSHVYLIHNVSNKPLWLFYVGPHPGASAGWASELDAKRFSVLLMQKKAFVLGCQYATGQLTNKKADCSQLLQVSVIKKIVVPQKDQNESFWVAENMKYPDLLRHLQTRGFKKSEIKGGK